MPDADNEEAEQARANVARNVTAARHRLGMSQIDLAAKSGVAQQQISLIEQGAANVTVRTLARLAQALGLEAWNLLRRSGKD